MTKTFASILRRQMIYAVTLGNIKSWSDVKKKFLHHLFENDIEIMIHTLLANKQKENKTVKNFVEYFQEMSLRCPHDM